MTLLEAPVVETANASPPTTSGWFRVGQLTEKAIVAFGANPASLYLLLCKRVRYRGDQAGTLEQPYSPGKTAELFGCSRRQLYDCMVTLLKSGAVRVRRTQTGYFVTIAGYPKGAPSQIRAAQVCRSEAPEFESGTGVPGSETEAAQVCRSEAAQVCRSPILIQESLNQEGGEAPAVDHATASTPPILEKADETTRDAILEGESVRHQRFPEPVKAALVYALSSVDEPLRRRAVRDACTVMAGHPQWNHDAPQTWADQVKKAAGKRQVVGYRPPPEAPPPVAVPTASRETIEAARALLRPKGLDKPNQRVRERFGAVA